jgi:hypothetical protein
MIAIRLTQKFLLALACLALVAFVPLSVGAQNVIEKGAQGVKKGVETGAEKTKEGAEAVGKGVKDTFSSDESRQKTETQTQTPTEPRQKPAAPTTSESKTKSTTSEQKTEATKSTAGTEKGGKQMPATAGELPLLLLAGGMALAAAGTLKLARRTN